MKAATMMMIVAATLLARVAVCQELSLDLASEKDVRVQVAPLTTATLVIQHAIPGKSYKITIEKGITPIQPLPEPTAAVPTPSVPKAAVPNECVSLIDATEGLRSATDETAIPAALTKLQASLKEGKCQDQSYIAAAQLTIDKTTIKLPGIFDIPIGQSLKLTVQRSDDTTKSWQKVFFTAIRGNWIALSTLAFAPHRDKEYFAAPADNGKFNITTSKNRKFADVIPAVLFTWLPTKQEEDYMVPSVAGGLGFDSSNPVVFFGGSLTFNQNLGVTAGLVLQKQNRLAGKYSVGQTVGENLTSQQLEESSYHPNVFLGFTYRFSQTKNLGK